MRTPEAHRAVLEAFRLLRNEGPFVPLSVGKETIVFPGYDGGAEWGGSAFDPDTALFYVNSKDQVCTGSLAPNVAGRTGREIYLRDCANCHRDDRQGTPPQIPSLVGVSDRRNASELTKIIRQGSGRMPGFPTLSADAVPALVEYLRTGEDRPLAGKRNARTEHSDDNDAPRSSVEMKFRFTGYTRFFDPDGYPAIAPPWGTLNAINLNTGEYAWTVPLGEFPELAAQGLKNTGSENYGGPVVTKGGVVFIGATSFDKKFRAFDKATGQLLWETTLPFAAIGTPATYEINGRQFVVVPAGGGKERGRSPSGGMYVAFALPTR
jgi:quinoprotein glucose dehydrogenase